MPSLPDYILAFWDDFEKQRDNIRSAAITNKKRNRKYVIKEELVASTLHEASYETDQAILNTLDMLSHHVQGYVNGLHFDTKTEKQMDEEFDDENGNNNTIEANINSSDFLIYDSPSIEGTSASYC